MNASPLTPLEAIQALGAMPEGYCFCSKDRIGDDSKIHEPECRDLRAAIAHPVHQPTADYMLILESALQAILRGDDSIDGMAGDIARAALAARPNTGSDNVAGHLPADTAPKDGTMICLLVDYVGLDSWTPLDDAEQAWTIGYNTLADTGDDEWIMVGWNWEQDCYTQGAGTIIGWLPFPAALSTPATEPQGLVWTDGDEESTAESPTGNYAVWESVDGWEASFKGLLAPQMYVSREAAKAAAQVNYVATEPQGYVAELEAAAKNLVWTAQTSGGVAGRDEGLVAACDRVETALAARPAPQPAADTRAVPRYATDEMMQAGLYHCSADMKWSDLFTAWHYMFDVAVGDNVTDSATPAPSDKIAEAADFATDVMKRLRRFQEVAEDVEGTGVDIGRDWLDVLTFLGLLARVRKSPASWQLTDVALRALAGQGETP